MTYTELETRIRDFIRLIAVEADAEERKTLAEELEGFVRLEHTWPHVPRL